MIRNYGIIEAYCEIDKDLVDENTGSFYIIGKCKLNQDSFYVYSKSFDTRVPESIPVRHYFANLGTIYYSATVNFNSGTYVTVTVKKNNEVIYTISYTDLGTYYIDQPVEIFEETTIETDIETDGFAEGNISTSFGYTPILSELITVFNTQGSSGGGGGGTIIG